ncbi:MAG: ABC transporter substrate-binding protein [Candidatus Binatia bacterium]|nr:ABC transporter substrate-binding protein [Candidatus Binatia bacterium]
MKLSWTHRYCALLVVLAATAGLAQPPLAEKQEHTNGGQPRPQRVVVLGPVLTDIVFALGADEQVVAVDAASVHPPAAAAKAYLPYYRNLNAEGVLAQRPDLVLAAEDAAPAHAVAQLRGAGCRFVQLSPAETFDELWTLIPQVGNYLGRQQEASSLVAALKTKIEGLRALALRSHAPPRALVLFAPGSGTVLAAGRLTAADELLRVIGATNAGTNFLHLKPLGPEAILESDPDWLIVTEQTVRTLGGVDALWQLPGVVRTRAARERHVFTAPDVAVLSLGPSSVDSAERLLRAFRGHDLLQSQGLQ